MRPHAAPPQLHATLLALVDGLSAELEPLHRRHNEALWMASVTGEPGYAAESARLDAEIRRILARPEPYALLQRVRAAGGVGDPLLDRQAELLHHAVRAHQIPTELIERQVRLEKSLETRFTTFRAELDGRRVSDNELRDVLRGSLDSEARRRAWEAAKQVGAEVEAELLELVRLRNQGARAVGFPDYYTMMLELDELPGAELSALLEQIDEGTRAPFLDYRRDLERTLAERFGIEPAALRPWHYADPFFQEAPPAAISLDRWFSGRALPELAERFFAAVGFDVRDLLARADLYERPGKSQHAFCLSTDRLDDIRVLCNLRDDERWMSTLLHELGHAVYDQRIDRGLPFLLRCPAHTLTTEATAMLFGRLSKNAAWLARHAGVDPAEARRAGDRVRQAIRDQLLVQARWCLVMCAMERELYRDPDQDRNARWWDLVERYQGVRRPEGREAPDWASKIHFSVAPVYYHNYLLGEVVASQLQVHLRDEVLGNGPGVDERYVSSPAVGDWLTERLFRPGRSVDWRRAVRESSGRALSAAALIAELERRR